MSLKPLKACSNSRLRCFSASLATVLEVVFAGSRIVRFANTNSYHQRLPCFQVPVFLSLYWGLKTAITSHLSSFASFHFPSVFHPTSPTRSTAPDCGSSLGLSRPERLSNGN